MKDINSSKSLEDLLNDLHPGEKNNWKEASNIIQNIETNAAYQSESSSIKNMKFANGNAQLKDFFEMIGEIVMSAMEDLRVEFLPYEYAVVYKKDSDQRLNKNIITYRVVDRRHSKNSGYKPKETSNILDKEANRTVTRYSERFTSVVQFCFMSMNYDEAFSMMELFEEIMINYAGELRGAGIVEYNFLNQNGDIAENAFREIMIVFTINYTVNTEKNRVITRENVKKVRVQGKTSNNDGKPLI